MGSFKSHKLFFFCLLSLYPLLSEAQSNVMDFDGVNDYVETGFIQTSTNMAKFTVECWVYGDTIPKAFDYFVTF